MSRLIAPLFFFCLLFAGGLVVFGTAPLYADSHEAAESSGEGDGSTHSTRMSACLAGCQSGNTYAQCVIYCGCMAENLARRVSVLDALGIGQQAVRGQSGFATNVNESTILRNINRCRDRMLQFAEEHQEQSPQ